MKNYKSLATAAVLTLLVTVLAACGSKDKTTAGSEVNNDDKLIEIVVGASIEPHSTILESEAVKNALAKEGYSIKVVTYTDYIQPNAATSDGSLDANFFQHAPYLNDYNAKNGTTLKSVADVHFEPIGLYPGKSSSLDDVKEGAQIAVPNDATNEARALLLLERAGLITLKENIGLDATINDILENPKNLKIVEVEAAQTAKILRDVDFAVINGNYALAEGLSAAKDALAVEDVNSEAALTYANILVVKEGNEESPKTLALIKAIVSEELKAFIDEKWQGAVVPVF